MTDSLSKELDASVVIPLYNNEQTLVKQLEELYKHLKKACNKFEIIVCDDKSTDSSAELLKKYYSNNPNFILIFHKKNLGIAKTIFSIYSKAKYEYIVLFSVDGDWKTYDTINLLKIALKNEADIVIGKRDKVSYSLYRKALSYLYNFLPYLLFQVNTIDAGSIKVIKRKLFRNTPLISKSIFFEAELIIRAIKTKKKVTGVDIRFTRNSKSKSSGGKLTLIYKSLVDLLILRFKI